MKNLFNIYHPIGGALNTNCVSDTYQYEQVATIEADSLLDAYRKAQNDYNSEYAELGFRSTCVGDIITESDEFGNVTHHIIDGSGFIKVSEDMLLHTDVELNQTISAQRMQQMLDYPEDYGLI